MAQIQKRARAETQTRTSPQPTHIHVEDQEQSFTLFDDSEVVEMAGTSRFEGQLSDISEDDLELPPLTPSPPVSEVGDDEGCAALGNLDAPSGAVPSGDWKGTRKPSKGYHLPGATENLCGPPVEVLPLELTGLDKTQKEIIKKFCEYLTVNWPSQRLSTELAGSRHSAFVDPTGFWHALFQTEFPRYIGFLHFYQLSFQLRNFLAHQRCKINYLTR
jgi:hypothetical protein